MKALAVAFLLGFALLATAKARLGETQAECEKRYGEFAKMIRPYAGQDIFKTRIENKENTMAITLWFIDGKCEAIEYACRGRWDDKELEDLYQKNFGQKKYTLFKKFTRIVEGGGMMVPAGDDGLIVRDVIEEDSVAMYSEKFLEAKRKAEKANKDEAPKSRLDGL
jgi:hypothetical protein